MGMNNVWYPYVEMAADPELKTLRAELRMNAYANHGGVDKRAFELYALAASIVGKCEFCIASHYKLLKETGVTDAAAARRRPHRRGGQRRRPGDRRGRRAGGAGAAGGCVGYPAASRR